MEDIFKESLDRITSNKDAYNIVYELVEDLITKLYKDKDIEELIPDLMNIKLKKNELRKVLIESMIETRISKLLLTTVVSLLIDLIEPELYYEKYEESKKIESKDYKKSSDEKNLAILLKILFDIAKKNMIEATRKKKLKISPEGQNEWLDLAITLYKKNKPVNRKYTKFVALIKANKELDYLPEESIHKNPKHYVNILQQHENHSLKKN